MRPSSKSFPPKVRSDLDGTVITTSKIKNTLPTNFVVHSVVDFGGAGHDTRLLACFPSLGDCNYSAAVINVLTTRRSADCHTTILAL